MNTSSAVVGSCFLLVFVIFCPMTLGDRECVGLLLIAVCINNVLVRSWLSKTYGEVGCRAQHKLGLLPPSGL